jgi:hypothetical protein
MILLNLIFFRKKLIIILVSNKLIKKMINYMINQKKKKILLQKEIAYTEFLIIFFKGLKNNRENNFRIAKINKMNMFKIKFNIQDHQLEIIK